MDDRRIYFVTGSDTATGKTTVAVAILAAAVRRGLRVAAMKPIESGCAARADGSLRPADAERLREAAGGHQTLANVCPCALAAPLAPSFAADLEGRAIDLRDLGARAAAIAGTGPDLFLIEGAGGLLVPLGPSHRVVDLVEQLGHALLVVGRTALGTINHTSMTVECALRRSIPVAGIVLSQTEGASTAGDLGKNRAAIERFTGVPVLGCLPFLPGASLLELAAAAEKHLDLDRLLPAHVRPAG